MDPNRRAATQKSTLRFVSDLCDLAATYLKNRQMRQMMSQQRLWNQLEGFTHQIHASLDLKETAYAVANDGKRLVGLRPAERGLEAERPGDGRGDQRPGGRRAAGQPGPRADPALQGGDPFGRRPGLHRQHRGFAPDIRDALELYVDESGAKAVIVTLLHKPETDEPRQGQGAVRLPDRRADRRRGGPDRHARPDRGRLAPRLDGALELAGARPDLPDAAAQGDRLPLAVLPRADPGQDRGGAAGDRRPDRHPGVRPLEAHDRGPGPAAAREAADHLRAGRRDRRRPAGRPRQVGQEGRRACQARQPRAAEGAEAAGRRDAGGADAGQLPDDPGQQGHVTDRREVPAPGTALRGAGSRPRARRSRSTSSRNSSSR